MITSVTPATVYIKSPGLEWDDPYEVVLIDVSKEHDSENAYDAYDWVHEMVFGGPNLDDYLAIKLAKGYYKVTLDVVGLKYDTMDGTEYDAKFDIHCLERISWLRLKFQQLKKEWSMCRIHRCCWLPAPC